MKRIIPIIALALLAIESLAASISGRVKDQSTRLPLEGANIWLEEADLHAVADPRGRFTIGSLPAGIQTLHISHVGYEPFVRRIDTGTTVHTDFLLIPRILPGQDIVITSDRYRFGASPTSFSDVSGAQLKQNDFAQDLTDLLDQTPSLVSMSYSGTEFGYRDIRIRGFDQRRIGVMINGIPLNDPEDHFVYWVDMPDLGTSLDDIQVVRGLGVSYLGGNEFGGSINMRTNRGDTDPGLWLRVGGGSFNTRTLGFGYNSGYVRNFSFSSRFSLLHSDGFRRRSGVDMWSYYLSGTRYLPATRITLNTYGGAEISQQAFNVIAASVYETDRRQNDDSVYDNSVDHFSQPHHELHINHKLSDRLQLDARLYYITGSGYYENLKPEADLSDFGLEQMDGNGNCVICTADLARRKIVDKRHGGIITQFIYSTHWGRILFGLDSYAYGSRHHGVVLWTIPYPTADGFNHEYYRYGTRILHNRAFLTDEFRVGDRMTITANLQVINRDFKFDGEKVAAFSGDRVHHFQTANTFVQPKIGMVYQLNEQNSVYTSLGQTWRAPSDADYWDAWQGPDDVGALPLFSTWDYDANGERVWSEPLVDPEKMLSAELGWQRRTARSSLALNSYWMRYENEIISAGEVSDEGAPLKGNVDESLHMGVEVDGRLQLPAHLQLNGNFTWSRNRAEVFTEYLYDPITWEVSGHDRSGNTLPLFPSLIGNVSLQWRPMRHLHIVPALHYSGEQYLDFSETETHRIDGYTRADLTIGSTLPLGASRLDMNLKVRNLLNVEYETSGYYDAWAGENFYYPGATRSFTVTVGMLF